MATQAEPQRGNGKQRARIVDVARLADVSVPTVSRVLNGSSPASPDTIAKVMSAVKELGYRPKGVARRLVAGSRDMIAVLASDTRAYGVSEVLAGIESAARRDLVGVTISIIESTDPSDVEQAIINAFSREIVGAIVVDFDTAGQAALQRLPSSAPAVGITGFAERFTHIPYARIDEESGGRSVTEHLLDIGHETVHHIAEPDYGRAAGRTTGWRSALASRGLPTPPVWTAGIDPDSSYDIGTEIAHRADVTAVFCATDLIAVTVLRALLDHGIKVPHDKSLAGFDDQPFAKYLTPSLTTAVQEFALLGQLAFRQLKHLRNGEHQPPDLVIRPSLVARESTGPVRATGLNRTRP